MALSWQTEVHRYRRYFVNIRQFYRQKKVLVYTEIILSLLTTAFFIIFAIKPTLVTIAGLSKEIKDKKMVTQKLAEKINNLNLAQQEYEELRRDLYLVEQALPSNSQISLLVAQIEMLASSTGVIVGSVNYSSTPIREGRIPSDDQARRIAFSLLIQGDYEHLKNFLFAFNNLRRIIRVKEFGITLSKSPIGEPKEALLLNTMAEAFYKEKK